MLDATSRHAAGNAPAVFEASLWLALAAALYAGSFAFEREIEIYKFGATAWPRVILLLIAIAALGQLVSHLTRNKFSRRTVSEPAETVETVHDSPDGHGADVINIRQQLWTFGLLLLPFAYMLIPQWTQTFFTADGGLNKIHTVKLICAVTVLIPFIIGMRHHAVGAMLTLPIFFGALMQDFGFYFLAPFFAVGVMYLMGERRAGWMAFITVTLISTILILFVSLLYVGLPTGNISPFYDIGNAIVTFLQ